MARGRKRTRDVSEGNVDTEEPFPEPSNMEQLADVREETAPDARKRTMAEVARRRAAHFAQFQADDDDDDGNNNNNNNVNNAHVGGTEARNLGPWSSARELVEARAAAAAAREDKLHDAAQQAAEVEVQWTPTRDATLGPMHPPCCVAPLLSMAVRVITQHIDCVETLYGIPDAVKVKIAEEVCRTRALGPETAALFVEGAPTDVVLSNCTLLDAACMDDLLPPAATDRLERLELGKCGRGFTDSACAIMARHGPLTALRVLQLDGAYRMSDEGLTTLLRATPNVTTLKLANMTKLNNDALLQLPSLVPDLQELDLCKCRGVGGSELRTALPQLRHLQRLSLNSIPEVDDGVVTAVAAACDLRAIDIGCCALVSDAALIAVASCCRGLQSLIMTCCHRVSDAGLHAIASQCSQLQVLDVERCSKLSDEALESIVSNAALQHVNVNSVHKAGAKFCIALSKFCKSSLETLDVSFCRGIPAAGMGLVADSCRNLRCVTVYGCTQFTRECLYGHSNENAEFVGVGTQVQVPA